MKVHEILGEAGFNWSKPNQARSMARYGRESIYSSGVPNDHERRYGPVSSKKKKIYNTPEDKAKRQAINDKFRTRGPRDV